MLRYLLLGRAGSGRTFFQKLAEKQGLVVAKSCTTRPQKDENDNMHIFADNIKDCPNPILVTQHNGFIYCYNKRDVQCADIIPIDPENVRTVCEMFPDDIFRIVEIMAKNEDRLAHAVTDAKDKLTAENDFLAECEEENKAFCKFEDDMANGNLNIDNVYLMQIINNDFTPHSDAVGFAEQLPAYMREFKRMRVIIEEMKAANKFTIQKDAAGNEKIRVFLEKTDNNSLDYRDISTDQMAETVLIDPDGIKNVVGEWLRLEKTGFVI